MTPNEIAEYVGWAALAWIAFRLLTYVPRWFAFFCRGRKDLTKYGQWAIVTGSTDGIGKGYAFELAKSGLNVLLIARSKERLQQTEQEIKAAYPKVTLDHLVVDFKDFNASLQEDVRAKIASLDIGVLVNNVGTNHGNAYVHEFTLDQDMEQLNVTVMSMMKMSRIVLGTEEGPGMLQRKRGCIVNLGSLTGFMPCSPFISMYGASKTFVAHLSRSMRAEYADYGIDVNCHIPGLVSTKLAFYPPPSLTVPNPAKFSKACVDHIGYEDMVGPYWPHAVEFWLQTKLPPWMPLSATLGANKIGRAYLMGQTKSATDRDVDKGRQELVKADWHHVA